MQFPNKVYDFVKWLVMIVLPAFSVAYFGLAETWDLPNATKVVATIAILSALLGTLVGISTARFNAQGGEFDGTINLEEDPGGMKTVNMLIEGDPETALLTKDKIVFKVVKTQVE